MLGTTRQAAFQRFGRSIDPRSGLTMSRSAPPDAADRAVAIFGWHDEGRYAEIIQQLDETMRGWHGPEVQRPRSSGAGGPAIFGAVPG